MVVGSVGRRWAASEGVRRPRRRTVITEFEVEAGSGLVERLHVGGADPLHVARTVSTVAAVARDRLCVGWYDVNSGDFWRRLVRQRVTTVSGTGSITPYRP